MLVCQYSKHFPGSDMNCLIRNLITVYSFLKRDATRDGKGLEVCFVFEAFFISFDGFDSIENVQMECFICIWYLLLILGNCPNFNADQYLIKILQLLIHLEICFDTNCLIQSLAKTRLRLSEQLCFGKDGLGRILMLSTKLPERRVSLADCVEI